MTRTDRTEVRRAPRELRTGARPTRPGPRRFDTDEAAAMFAPKKDPVAWLSIRFLELEVRATKVFFTAQQVATLWNSMPKGDLWAELRVQLLGICYRRIVDLENLGEALLNGLDVLDLERVKHRLGVLSLFNPRHPARFHRFVLSNWDERQCAKILLRIADDEDGEQVKDERFRRSESVLEDDWWPGWLLPAAWLERDPKDQDDLQLPKQGTLSFTFHSPKLNWALRDSFLPLVAAGSAPPEDSLLRITPNGHILKR